MGSTRIKKDSSRDRVNTECTHHNLRRSLHGLSIHMIHLAQIACRPQLVVLILGVLLLWAVGGYVTLLATVVTLDRLIRGTILVGSIVGVVRALDLLILVKLLALLEW